MNYFKHWYYFQKTDRDFLNLSFNKQKIVSEMNNKNERRKVIQQEIYCLTSVVDTCKYCEKSCCRGNYNHFFIVDFIIRLFSTNPINEFNRITRKQPTLLKLLFYQITNKKSGSSLYHHETSKCPDLTSKGCAFSPADRPIRCILFTCKSLRKTLPKESLNRIGELSKELVIISKKAFKLVQR